MRKICIVPLGVCLSSLVLAAELVVIESTSPDYLPGEILDTEINIVLDQDAEIILIAEDGTIVLLSGPYVGPPTGDETGSVSGALDALSQLVGYAEVDAGDIGGVRGDVTGENFLVQDVDDHRTSPWLLHAAITGPQCVRAEAEDDGYWREQSNSDERLEVKRVASGETVSIAWKAGDNTVAWPVSLPLLADEMYLLRLGDQLRSTNLLVREVPAAVNDDGVAMVAFLAAKGCISQARMVLDRLHRNP